MTRKMKMLGRIKGTRKLVRDVHAAKNAVAETRRAVAEEDRSDAAEALDELYRDASTRFVEAETVRDLWQYEMERMQALAILRGAEKKAAEAEKQAEQTRKELWEKERELRKTEKVMEKQRAKDLVDERRAEQKAADDAAGRRK